MIPFMFIDNIARFCLTVTFITELLYIILRQMFERSYTLGLNWSKLGENGANIKVANSLRYAKAGTAKYYAAHRLYEDEYIHVYIHIHFLTYQTTG